MKEKIIAVLVTYNPQKEHLLENIKSILNDVNKIIICNNSSVELKEIIGFSDELLNRIQIIDFLDNLGIAEAQNVGFKIAYESGADYILQMDQDTIMPNRGVIELYNSYLTLRNNGIKIGIIGGVVSQNSKNIKMKKIIQINGKLYKEKKAIISSGSLISRDVYEKVGGMMSKLFIDHVDTEYCWRIKKYGFSVIQDLQVVMEHQIGNGTLSYKGRDYLVSSPIRNYYQIRNSLYLLGCKYAPFSWKKNEIKIIIRHLIIFPKIMDNGELRKKYMYKGIKDFIMGKMGRIDKEIKS